MAYKFLDVAITPSVKAAQAEMGADHLWRDFTGQRDFDRFSAREADFIAARDSFYIASVSESGWPYVQHRGGQPGFLKVLDERTFAFPDFRGNRQYISTGNFRFDNRAALILVDYPARARLKIYAHVEQLAVEAEPELAALLANTEYRSRPERLFRLRLEAFDWNCPQHITPRYTEAEISAGLQPLRVRLAELEEENARLRSAMGGG